MSWKETNNGTAILHLQLESSFVCWAMEEVCQEMQHLQLSKKQQQRNRMGSLSLQSHPVVCVQY